MESVALIRIRRRSRAVHDDPPSPVPDDEAHADADHEQAYEGGAHP